MKRLCRLLQQQELHVLFFGAGFILFNWPLLSLFGLDSLKDVFNYLFMAWGAIILILFLIGKSRPDSDSQF